MEQVYHAFSRTLMGAWIETLWFRHTRPGNRVAPYMGAWIETCQR